MSVSDQASAETPCITQHVSKLNILWLLKNIDTLKVPSKFFSFESYWDTAVCLHYAHESRLCHVLKTWINKCMLLTCHPEFRHQSNHRASKVWLWNPSVGFWRETFGGSSGNSAATDIFGEKAFNVVKMKRQFGCSRPFLAHHSTSILCFSTQVVTCHRHSPTRPIV